MRSQLSHCLMCFYICFSYFIFTRVCLLCFYKKKWANPGLFFVYFRFFKHNNTEKTVGFSGIRTRIVGVEGEHADHLTTTTAQVCLLCSCMFFSVPRCVFCVFTFFLAIMSACLIRFLTSTLLNDGLLMSQTFAHICLKTRI